MKCNEPLPYRINMERRPIIYQEFSFGFVKSRRPNEY